MPPRSGPSSPPLPEVPSDLGFLTWLRRTLVAWFRRRQRPLPWRRNRDPYAILVSEVMLQQTQVATVVPYFERFLRAFPNFPALARADEQDVLRLWEGLGYYRRARALHRAARYLTEHHRGRLPDDPEVVETLPGVGRYTLGAVLSQAFDRRLPILEANSRRVLARLFALGEDPGSGAAQRWLWQTAETILPPKGVGDFNQALMELGALVCTPTAPHCEACPLRRRCQARLLNLQETIPPRPVGPAVTQVREAAVVVRRGAEVFFVQRADDASRWAGLWEFPHGPLEDGETHETAAARVLKQATGLEAELGPELLTLAHGVTRFRITMVCFQAVYRRGRFRAGRTGRAAG